MHEVTASAPAPPEPPSAAAPQDLPTAPEPEAGAADGGEECKGEVTESERAAAASEDPYQSQPVPP
eukprot:5228825-Alexandrium_andersonii.AAC.1